MPAEPAATLRAGALLGRPVHDRDGTLLGRIADLVTRAGPDGREQITELIVTSGPWGRLLGYEDAQPTGPWPLDRLAHVIIRRHVRRIPWDEADLDR
jgi:hypothetical protein